MPESVVRGYSLLDWWTGKLWHPKYGGGTGDEIGDALNEWLKYKSESRFPYRAGMEENLPGSSTEEHVFGFLQVAKEYTNKRVAVVVCGANISLEKLNGVIQ